MRCDGASPPRLVALTAQATRRACRVLRRRRRRSPLPFVMQLQLDPPPRATSCSAPGCATAMADPAHAEAPSSALVLLRRHGADQVGHCPGFPAPPQDRGRAQEHDGMLLRLPSDAPPVRSITPRSDRTAASVAVSSERCSSSAAVPPSPWLNLIRPRTCSAAALFGSRCSSCSASWPAPSASPAS